MPTLITGTRGVHGRLVHYKQPWKLLCINIVHSAKRCTEFSSQPVMNHTASKEKGLLSGIVSPYLSGASLILNAIEEEACINYLELPPKQ